MKQEDIIKKIGQYVNDFDFYYEKLINKPKGCYIRGINRKPDDKELTDFLCKSGVLKRNVFLSNANYAGYVPLTNDAAAYPGMDIFESIHEGSIIHPDTGEEIMLENSPHTVFYEFVVLIPIFDEREKHLLSVQKQIKTKYSDAVDDICEQFDITIEEFKRLT